MTYTTPFLNTMVIGLLGGMGLSDYIKKIAYIDLYEEEEKIKNIGYVKSRKRDGIWNLTVHVQGLAQTDTLLCELKTIEGKQPLGQINIRNGNGDAEFVYTKEDLKTQGVTEMMCNGLKLFLSANRYGLCRLRDIQLEASEEKTVADIEVTAVEKTAVEKIAVEETAVKKIVRKKVTEQREVQVSGNKWEQLCKRYPPVAPFKESVIEEFLSLKPEDFVVLSEKDQTLANNSFLLHGFYNYKHILLGKQIGDAGNQYYIGVPGICHEREKMVAVMFGFEAFEAVEQETQGAFGYYLKRVDL
ncbi:MAG: DUF6128 domain-containing protein [Lachnospiraceae bacterium]